MDGLNAKLDKPSPLDAAGLQTNLFGCLSDPKGFAVSFCLPCVPTGLTKATLDGRPFVPFDAICCANAYQVRQTLRTRHNLPTDEVKDLVGACCCQSCFVHQNTRELARLTNTQPQFLPESSSSSPAAAASAPAVQSMAVANDGRAQPVVAQHFGEESPAKPAEGAPLIPSSQHQRKPPTVPSAKYEIDQTCRALWSDGNFYDSRITQLHDDGTYTVEYSGFGESATLPPASIKPM